MSTKRLIWFGISILIGLVLGLMLGWGIKPLKYQNMQAETLREDYKVDYVLMVAEGYKTQGDINYSIAQLNKMEPDTKALRVAQDALLSARKIGYPLYDMESLGNLVTALEAKK